MEKFLLIFIAIISSLNFVCLALLERKRWPTAVLRPPSSIPTTDPTKSTQQIYIDGKIVDEKTSPSIIKVGMENKKGAIFLHKSDK